MNENWELDSLMGKKVKDKVTGFTGLITGKVEALYGCTQYIITAPVNSQGKADDNKAIVDEGRIKVLGQGIRPKTLRAKSGKKGFDNIPKQLGKQI